MRDKYGIGLLTVLALLAICVVLHLTKPIVVPLVIAMLLVQACRPVIALGRKIKLPQAANVVLVFIFIFVLFFIGVRLGIAQIVESRRVFEQYSPRLVELIGKGLAMLDIPPESLSVTSLVRRYIGNISGGILNFSSQFILTLVFLMFMLLEAPGFDKKLDRAFPDAGSEKIKRILGAISHQTSRYLGIMVIISFFTGLFIWAALAVIGVEFAVGWGVLAFALNFIPTIGSIAASVPPILMAILQFSPTGPETIATLIAIGVIQMVSGNVIAPKMLGESLGLSPVVVMLSLLVWTLILGIAGAILSVPIAAVMKIICENIPALSSVAVLMGSTPPPPRTKTVPPAPPRPTGE